MVKGIGTATHLAQLLGTRSLDDQHLSRHHPFGDLRQVEIDLAVLAFIIEGQALQRLATHGTLIYLPSTPEAAVIRHIPRE